MVNLIGIKKDMVGNTAKADYLICALIIWGVVLMPKMNIDGELQKIEKVFSFKVLFGK